LRRGFRRLADVWLSRRLMIDLIQICIDGCGLLTPFIFGYVSPWAGSRNFEYFCFMIDKNNNPLKML
jgi:hypothetical protein